MISLLMAAVLPASAYHYCGDANLDGYIGRPDIEHAQVCVSRPPEDKCHLECDVTGDDRCDLDDVDKLDRYTSGSKENLVCALNSTSKKKHLCGDGNRDAELNVSDLLASNKCIFGSSTHNCHYYCDMSGDGVCNVRDLLLISKSIFDGSKGMCHMDKPIHGRCASRLNERKEQALARMSFTPYRDYHKMERSTVDIDCSRMWQDSYGLAAKLALGEILPAEAEPMAKHIADNMFLLFGPEGDGRCEFLRSGTPGGTLAYGAISYVAHKHGRAWSQETKASFSKLYDIQHKEAVHVHNDSVGVMVGKLLLAEYLGDQAKIDHSVDLVRRVTKRTLQRGGIEIGAPMYTEHQLSQFVMGVEAEHPKGRAWLRTLLDYALLATGHMYMNGAIGAPQVRDYYGGIDDDRRSVMAQVKILTGDPRLTVERPYSVSNMIAVSDYELSPLMCSIFMDKEDGYNFQVFTEGHQGLARTPYSLYTVGADGLWTIPWQVAMLPHGRGMLGASYGWRRTSQYVSNGLYVKDGDEYHILYQHQPLYPWDKDHYGSAIGGNVDPDDFYGETYQYRRYMKDQTLISLWDTTISYPSRRYKYTLTHLPDYHELGHETALAGGWRVAKVGEAYIAWAPIGAISLEEKRELNGKPYRYIRIDGRSGGVSEIADTSQYADLEAYVQDLRERQPHYGLSPEFYAEVKTQSGDTIRLEYGYPEKRFLNGAEISVHELFSGGLMDSPWVKFDYETKKMTVEREPYGRVVYDWLNGAVVSN